MKKLIIAALVAVFVTTSAFADVAVSTRITDNFKSEFEGASNVSWTVSKDFTKASFVLNGDKMEAFFGNDGAVIAISKAIALDKLPREAVRAITKKYQFPPYTLKECIELTNADGDKKYYVSLEEQGNEKIILQVSEAGSVEVFKKDKIK